MSSLYLYDVQIYRSFWVQITVSRQGSFLHQLPGYFVHMIAYLILLELLDCYLRLKQYLCFLVGIQTSSSVLSWPPLLSTLKCWRWRDIAEQCLDGSRTTDGLILQLTKLGQILDCHTISVVNFIGLAWKG